MSEHVRRDERRREAIVRLLETRDEHLPEPTRRADGVAGFVHRVRVPETCEDCLANGRVSVACENCHGRGEVLVWRERDPYAKSEVKAYGLDGSHHDATHERDRQIDALDQQLRPPRSEAAMLEEANQTGYAWERAREHLYSRFDYGILDLALDELRAHDDSAYRALHAVYVYRWLTEAGGAAEQACERGFAFLSPRLAAFEFARGRKLRAPGVEPVKRIIGPMRAEAGDVAKGFRDEQMRNRAAAGAKPAEIAKEFRVSIRTVYRAVNEAA